MSLVLELKALTEEALLKIAENHRLMRGTNVSKEIHQLTVKLNKAASLGERQYEYKAEVYEETMAHFQQEGLTVNLTRIVKKVADELSPIIYTTFSWD